MLMILENVITTLYTALLAFMQADLLVSENWVELNSYQAGYATLQFELSLQLICLNKHWQ